MPLIQKKRPMLLLRVSYLDWSRLLLSASHLRRSLWPQTAQVSHRAGQCSNLRAGLPTCDILVGFTLDAMNCSYSPNFWIECVLVLKTVLFGAMFFLRVTPGLALMTEFYYSIFFPQVWGYSTVTECLYIAYQSIPNTRKGKKRFSSLVAGSLYLFNTSLLRYTVALTLPTVRQTSSVSLYTVLACGSMALISCCWFFSQSRASPSRGDFHFTFRQNWNCPWIQRCFRSYLKISFFVQVLSHTQINLIAFVLVSPNYLNNTLWVCALER